MKIDGYKIDRLLLIRGWSDKEFAKRAGVSPQRVSQFRHRVYKISTPRQTMALIAKTLGVEVDDIIS